MGNKKVKRQAVDIVVDEHQAIQDEMNQKLIDYGRAEVARGVGVLLEAVRGNRVATQFTLVMVLRTFQEELARLNRQLGKSSVTQDIVVMEFQRLSGMLDRHYYKYLGLNRKKVQAPQISVSIKEGDLKQDEEVVEEPTQNN